MKTMKRLVAIALSVLMIFGSFSMIANAWDARNADGITLSITTKIFRLVDGKWTETEKVKQGEEVRARVYLNTDYYTNTGNLLFFYNNDFYEDSFGIGQNELTVNPYYKTLPYGITGTYVGDESTSDVENFMIANGKITPGFADAHNFVYISYHFASGANNQKFNGSQWLFEFPLTVKADAADGTGIGDFFALEETTRSTSFKKGRMNVPKGPYDGTNETITSMANWDAVLDYSSQTVTLFENFVTASFDAGLGEFADKSTEFYAEGDAGDALTVPTPTRSNYKFMGWKLKGADDSTAAEITEFPAEAGEYEAVWKSTTETGEELTFITKIYRLDPETNEWIYTDRVKPGEKVKARLFVDTSYFTNAGNIIMFYDSEFFTDSYVYNEKNDLVPNDSATSSAAINRVNGDFAKIDGTNYSLQDLVAYGYITQDFADTHTAITARYQFNPSTSKKISGDEWFIEFDLEVLDTASGMGEFFIVEETIKNSGDGVYAYINIPLGEEGGSKEETSSMHLWDVNATVKSYPVYTESKITLDANGGNFGAAGETSYVIEGTIGEAVDYTAVPDAVRDGYTFTGWVDASVENPTAADIVDLPAEMPYNDAAYKAFWTNNVEITFVIGDTEIKRIVTAGDPFEVPEDPEIKGNFFIDWSTDKTGATLSGLPANYPAADETYYAIFEANTYSVTYYVLNPVTNRFEVVNSGSVTYGDTIVTVPGSYVAPEGYALSKAYADVGLTKEFAAGQKMPAEEVNIYFYLEEVIYDAVFMVDGEEYERIPVMYGSEITPPEAPTKAGYDFAGWDPYVGTMDEAGMVFEAIWTPAEYTVTWVVDGETYDAFDIVYEGEMEIPADPDVTGYDFIGWSEDENATEAGTVAATMPANDVTYYAVLKVKQYTISFAETGDSVIDDITQDYGSEIVAPADPVKKGYTFNGWLDAEGNEADVPATMPAEDVVLKADWVINQYTVTWIFDNGSENQVDTYDYNDVIVAPEAPEKVGHTFKEWSPKVETNMPAMNLEYTAVYTVDTHNAVFNANGGAWGEGETAETTKTVPTLYGEEIVAPEDPAYKGYVFAGWDNTVGVMGIEDQTFTAQWDAATDTPYTVEYYTMDTTGAYDEENPVVDKRTGTTNATVTAVTNTTEGFYVDKEKSVLTDTVSANGDTVLKVYYARNLYTVTFDATEGGTLEGAASAEYFHGAAVSVPTASKTGYTFKSWDKNVSTVAVADAAYVAQWTANEYTITFNTDGGTAIDPVKAAYGSDVNAPAAVTTKEGYTFNGWAETQGETSKDKAVTFPVTMPLDGDTYYAIWTPNQYTITFANTGDSVIDPITQDYKTTVTAPADPVKEGHKFEGWDDEIPTTMPAYNMTINATWSVVSYDVTWDVDGAETTEKVEFGAAIVAPEDPEKDGYTFAGWSPDVPETMPAEEQTFTATWDANEYTITFDTDGGNEIADIVADYESDISDKIPADPEKTGYDFAGWVDENDAPATVPSTMPLEGMALKATWTPKSDTPFKVVVHYNDYTTGDAMTEEFADYTGTTGYAIEIVEAEPDELAAETVYVLLSDLAISNYELDETAENQLTGVVAADGSTVLNLYYVPVKRTITFDADGGTWADGESAKAVEVSHGSLIKPHAPAEDPVKEGYTFTGWGGLTDALKAGGNRTFTATWEAKSYTITWKYEDGVTADKIDPYSYNGVITMPTNPTREGYDFAGWVWTNEAGEAVNAPVNMPAYNVVATATWDVLSYDVTWKVDDKETTEKVAYGAEIVAPADPVKEGYTFTGWSPEVPENMPASEQTFTAQWAVNPYTVSYYVYEPATGKFAAAGTKTVDYGTVIPTEVPADYTVPAGYSLVAKAYTDVSLAAPLADGKTMPAENITLYYELKANTYNAVFTVDGVEHETVPTEFGKQIVAPSDPTKTGYTFTGWEPEVGVMDDVNGKTYEAQWEKKTYNAIFKANGGLFADGETTTVVETKFGEAIVAPAAPVKEGNRFLGWATTATALEAGTVATAMPANDVTYYAVYKVEQYTITFNTDGGSPVEDIVADYGSPITAPKAPTKTGHSFAGWDSLPATMPEGGKTVKALWTVDNYTVTWKVDGSIIKSETLAYGANIVAPADPVKEGNEFDGWTPAPAATMPAQNVEYTATWAVKSYTATFDANGGKYENGATTKTDVFEFGETVTAPEIPTQTGYAFAGWEPALGTMPAADTTYKAVWTVGEAKAYTIEVYTMDTAGEYGQPTTETKTANVGEVVKVTATPGEGFSVDKTKENVLEGIIKADEATVLKVYYARNKYNITFNGNEGTVDGEASVSAPYYHGATVVAPAAERTGYSLTGWSPALSTVAVADATYDAQWEINKYTISFNSDGGSNVLPITQDYGTAIVAPAIPVKEGYEFKGWKDAEGNGIPETMPAEDTNLTAEWALAKFTVTFYSDSKMTDVIQQTENEYGVGISAPVATKEGHTFEGWVDEATGKVVDFTKVVSTPARDVDYYATWTVNEVDLIYRTYNGIYKEYKVAYGTAKADMPVPATDPTQPGHTFKGWSDLPDTMPASRVQISAQWDKNTYKANFYKDLGDTEVFDFDEVLYEDYITAPEENPKKDGYVFGGWSTDGENIIDDLGAIGAGDTAFYAVWSEATNVEYKVEHYYMNADKTYSDEATRVDTFNNGKTNASVTATPDTAENFTVDNAKSVLEGIVAADGSLVLKVYYEREINTLKIDVDGVVTEVEYPYEAPVAPVEKPVKEGSTFAGWVDGDGNPTDVPSTMPADDVVIKATWTVNKNNVTYNNEGEVYDGPTAVKYGDPVPVPAAPVKDGYKFDGWFDKDGKQPADYTSMPDNALEFTAKWTANSNVSYVLEVYEMDTEGKYPATATETVTYTDGVVDTTKTVEYTVPAGFTLDKAASVLTGPVPATGTLVLKAYLVRNIYKLNVVVNGETATEEYYYNEAVVPVADPVIDGFVFKGWVDAENNKATVPSIMPANDVTVYADFEEDEFEAKFDAGDGKFESTDSSTFVTDITFGQDIAPPTEKPVKKGYEFGGWATPDDPETPVTDFGKMDADGADYIAIWNKTDFDIVFYDYKPAENGPISPDVMYAYATQTKQMGDTVAVPGNPGTFEHYTFLGWSTVEGDSDSIVTEITMPAHDYALYAIYVPVKVMLIPKNDTCTTVIDRAGGDVDDYDAATSKWYVYGIKEYIKAPELLEKYIDVSGDGRIELIHVENGLGGTWEYTGTGTVINVYNRMGTPDDTSDDILVESFHIVIFGDINGDSVVQAIDATYVYDEAAGLTSWANPGSGKYVHYLAKAANVDGNSYVDAIDATYIGDHSIGIVRIDQVTGKLK